MTRLRRALGPIALAWLLCQASTLVLVTVAFALGSDAALLECTCAHGTEHKDCPMHHPGSPSRQGTYKIQCGGDTNVALLASLLGQVGLTPHSGTAIQPPVAERVAPPDSSAQILRPAPPEPPPPRA